MGERVGDFFFNPLIGDTVSLFSNSNNDYKKLLKAQSAVNYLGMSGFYPLLFSISEITDYLNAIWTITSSPQDIILNEGGQGIITFVQP